MKTKTTAQKHYFRMLCDGETEWAGSAYDADHAIEKCFWNEEPSAFSCYTLQRLSNNSQWITLFKNENL
jgi:hypothetical protein